MWPRNSAINDFVIAVFVIASWVAFASCNSRLQKISLPTANQEMQIALPSFVQILLAGGDRFLATNITVFRALVTSTEYQNADRYVIQAKIQRDAAWFNPYHEDNYYLAAAGLSWNDQLETAQHILLQASNARPFDMLPPFFYAFNEYHFRHDIKNGAKWLQIAATHTQKLSERLSLNRIAANWMVKGEDRHQALKMLEAMAAQSRYGSLRRQILQRAERVRNLILLDEAITAYQTEHHRLPPDLGALVTARLLDQLPKDPLGDGYLIDAQGKAQIKAPQKK